MRPSGVHHVSINVADVDAALAFYVEALGLKVRPDRPDFGVGGAWLDAGAQQVHLIQGDPPPNCGQHFALAFEDLDAVITELRGRGVQVSDAIPVVLTSAEVLGVLMAIAVLLWFAAALEARKLGPVSSPRPLPTREAGPVEVSKVRPAA